MKVLVTKDIGGIIIWKMDAKPIYFKPQGFKVKQWYSDKYWFDFNAKIFSYNEAEKMFPELIHLLKNGEIKEMEIKIV